MSNSICDCKTSLGSGLDMDRSLKAEVEILRDRLQRRNLVLETIQKAYHRDVSLVSNQLLAKRDNDSEIDPAQSFPPFFSSEKCSIQSLPSIDLRPIIQFFAPDECQLQVRPCHYCGGQLEIIHNDSSTIFELRERCTIIQSENRHLRLQTSRLCKQTEYYRKGLTLLRKRMTRQRNKMLKQNYDARIRLHEYKDDIKSLTHTVSCLEKDKMNELKSATKLNEVNAKLGALDNQIDTVRKHISSKNIHINELKNRNQSLFHLNNDLKNNSAYLSNEVTSLEKQLSILKDRVTLQKQESSREKEEKQRLLGIINDRNIEIENLTKKISQLNVSHETSMTSAAEQHKRIVDELISDIRLREEQNNMYEKKIGNIIKELKVKESLLQLEIKRQKEEQSYLNSTNQSKGSEPSEPSTSVHDELVIANENIDKLFHHVLFCGTELYHLCALQKTILGDENCENGITEEEREKYTSNSGAANTIENLNGGNNENAIDWESTLKEDHDCSLVLSYLCKRSQASLKALICMHDKNLHEKNTLLRKSKHDMDMMTRKLKKNFDDKFQSLNRKQKVSEKEKNNIQTKLRIQSRELEELETQTNKFRDEIASLRDEVKINLGIISKLENEKIDQKKGIQELETKNSLIKDESSSFRNLANKRDSELMIMDENMKSLRQQLTAANTTYEKMKERQREIIEARKAVGIQCNSQLLDKCIQT